MVEVRFGSHESRRISPSFGRQERRDPGVATIVRFFAELSADPPHHRVPPIDAADDQFRPAEPVIAALEMRKFMVNHGATAGVVEFTPKTNRKYEFGRQAAPNHRRDAVAHHQDARRPAKRNHVRRFINHVDDVIGRSEGARETSAKKDDANRCEKRDEPGADQPRSGRNRR